VWYRRPGETRPPTAATYGVAVHTGGRRLFFPGGNADAGMRLARLILSADELHAAESIEFGERDGDEWTPSRVIRGV